MSLDSPFKIQRDSSGDGRWDFSDAFSSHLAQPAASQMSTQAAFPSTARQNVSDFSAMVLASATHQALVNANNNAYTYLLSERNAWMLQKQGLKPRSRHIGVFLLLLQRSSISDVKPSK